MLRHVFGIAPETITQASDLLRFLLRRHYGRLRLPPDLEHHLVQVLQQDPVFAQWPLVQIVPDREAFFAFLQERWPIFLDGQTGGSVAVRETAEDYGLEFRGPARIPFDHRDVRVYIDNLFLEGALRPIAHPRGQDVAESWARAGIVIDPNADRERRLDGLLKSVEASIPKDAARHHDWLAFAPRWAQVNALVFDPDVGVADGDTRERYESIRDRIDQTFAVWIRQRFETLHNLPPSPPVMVHQIPRSLARAAARIHGREGRAGRDGRSRPRPMGGGSRVARGTASGVAVSGRQPLRLDPDADHGFQGRPVSPGACRGHFPTTIHSTDREPSAWKRFWGDEGLDAVEVGYAKNLRDKSNLGTVEDWCLTPRLARWAWWSTPWIRSCTA